MRKALHYVNPRHWFACIMRGPALSGLVGFVLVFVLMAVIAFTLIDRNREAIRTTCLLVSNSIVQGLSGNEAGNIVRAESLKDASPETLKRYRDARATQRPIVSPDCDKVADDPSSVKPEPRLKVQQIPDKPTSTVGQ